jgi:hypothetical protein
MRTREHCHVVNLDLDYDIWLGGLQRASFDGLKVWRGLNQFERDEEGNNALNSKARIHKNADQLIVEMKMQNLLLHIIVLYLLRTQCDEESPCNT